MVSFPLLHSTSRPPISQPFLLPELVVAPFSSSSLTLISASSTIRRSGKARSFAQRISLSDSPRHEAAHSQRDVQEPRETPARRSIWFNPSIPRSPSGRIHYKPFDNSRHDRLVEIARSLDACKGSELKISQILSSFGAVPSEADAISILNRLKNPKSALLSLRWFQEKIDLSREVVLYNVTMKAFEKSKGLDGLLSLLDEMLGRGVKPDNVTFSKVISCATYCNRPALAVEWFRRMPEFGCSPDQSTLTVMIEAYSLSGDSNMTLELYDRALKGKWNIRSGAFAAVIRVHTSLGDLDGALKVFDEMKTLEVKPNVAVFNALFTAMGIARKPWLVKAAYREMEAQGLFPNGRTYSSLLKTFGGARYDKDALSVYRRVKEEGVELELRVYNLLLTMCADLCLFDEAVEIFEDIKKLPGNLKPDRWSYSSLISAYSNAGQISELERAMKEMREAGFELNIAACMSVILCYGMVGRTDDVVRTVDTLLELDTAPDERLCSCLLNVMSRTPVEDTDKLIGSIVKFHAQLGSLVRLLVDENSTKEVIKRETEELINTISKDFKRVFCNFLIDICVNRGFLERACVLLDIALWLGIYFPLQSKTSMQWSLHLKGLSSGAARAALHVWMNDLQKALEKGEEFPPVLGIIVNHRKPKPKFLDKELSSVFESHLSELKAPFHEAPDKNGWFSTTKTAAETWLKSISSPKIVSA